MTQTVNVSVIVPAFNAEQTIGKCLLSLRSQTLRDMEVVVIDDGSTDQTSTIVSELATASAIPMRMIHQQNQGRAAARNRGLVEAKGEFVGFVDADDFAEPDMYKHLLDRALKTGCDLVVCEYESFDATTGETINHYREGSSRSYGTSVRENPALLTEAGASVCNKLARRSLFSEHGIDFPVGRDFEDLATSYRLALEANRIEKVDEVLYHYRQGHPSSIMSACDARYLQIADALKVVNDHFEASGALPLLRDELESINVIHLIIGRMNDYLRTACPENRREFIGRAFAHMDMYFPGWKSRALRNNTFGRFPKRLVATNRHLLSAYTGLVTRSAR